MSDPSCTCGDMYLSNKGLRPLEVDPACPVHGDGTDYQKEFGR